MNEQTKLIVSSSPHIRTPRDTKVIMLDVLIALAPAFLCSIIFFGWRPIMLTLISVVSCEVFEFAYRRLLKKHDTYLDLSAAVTGVLLAFCMPASAPWWLPIIGSLFAIVIVKQLFGGIGKNFLNPALAGRAFLLASYARLMTSWTPTLFQHVDAATYATPLASLSAGSIADTGLGAMLIGNTGGCIGEVSAIALLIGGAWLVYRKVISLRIPVSFIGTVAVVTLIFSRGNPHFQWMLQNLFSGGLMLGAIFMATDYCTSPVTPKGQVIFGIGCGLLTVLIRYFGSYPEGVSYAILIMNLTVWMIDKATAPRRFGTQPDNVWTKLKARFGKKEAAE